MKREAEASLDHDSTARTRRDFEEQVRKEHSLCCLGASKIEFPALGDEAEVHMKDVGLSLRHGTSLKLMADCSNFLNESKEFAEVDPSDDWEKWSSRQAAFSLYYIAVMDGPSMVACLRAVLDGFPSPQPPHRPRLVIDYVTTRPEHRGKGIASRLTKFVAEAAKSCNANLYVLALEESCVYWMSLGFILCEEQNINARLNIFPDTHLLKRCGDPEDPGCEEDLSLAPTPRMEDEEDELAYSDGENSEEDDFEETSDDESMQRAISLSLASSSGAVQQEATREADLIIERQDDDEDEELRAALALSLEA